MQVCADSARSADTMARKRKAPKTFEQPQTAKSAKFDIEEKFDDSEDEFYAGRDKVLLDESANTKRQRRVIEQERDLQPSDEEVLGYQDEPTSSEDEDEVDDEIYEEQIQPNSKASRRNDQEADEDEVSEDEHWGTNRADYYGDDAIETEEQAREEEAEAKRLHQKHLKNMTEADFGFDADEWVEEKKSSKQGRSVTEKLPEAQIPEGATEEQRLQILHSRYPEFVPLAEEFTRLQKTKQELDDHAKYIEKELKQGSQVDDGLPVSIKQNALSTYLATISMYFAVVTSTVSKDADAHKITAMAPLDLHEHPVIQSLARARQLWDQVEQLEVQAIVSPANVLPSPESLVNDDYIEASPKGVQPKKTKTKSIKVPAGASTEAPQPKSKTAKVSPDPVTTTKKKKSKKSSDKPKPLDIDALLYQSASESASDSSEFGDETPLTESQLAEKQRKRKSLRFYTSQIASKANKRGNKSRDAGGDDDLPYKERNRDRQDRLNKEAEARGRQQADPSNDFGGEDDYEDLPGGRDANDEYYATLLDKNAQKKSDKAAKAAAYAKATAEGATVYEEETVGADGKRAITYAIAKNKGLMPRRKKEVRNPRVKKRMKYDEKVKKLGSVRQVYKGGEGRGGYGGELTGIKTNVVKSVKL